MINRIHVISLLLSLFLFSSCQKEEGIGGKATIKGKIYLKEYVGGVLSDEYYAPEYDVYIIYGAGNTFYDDDIKTSYDGSFEFRYLRPGTYKVFAYTKHPTTGEITAEIQTVEISDKKEIIELDDIVVKS